MDKRNEHKIRLATDIQCTGCMACRNICPVDAITSIQNKRGFYRPDINHTKCIKCEKCVKTCPQINKKTFEIENQSYYAFKNTDYIRRESSSGGVFTWLSDYILEQNGTIFGCILDQNLHVIHVGSNDKKTRDKMRGSKYVQSDIGLVYRNVKRALEENRKVLFTGTPCQCEGLLSYLGKMSENENLFTLDFICEGGASPFIFKDFIKYYEGIKKIHIKDVFFRDKQRYPYEKPPILSRRLIVEGENSSGKESFYYNRKINDRFHDCLFTYTLQQNACEKCKFHSYNHCTDFTCGDFHRYHLNVDMKDDLGLSELLINSSKAEHLIQSVKKRPQIFPCKKQDVWQPLLEDHGKVWFLKKLFWKIYQKKGFEAATRLIYIHIYHVKIQRFWGYCKQQIKMVIK